MLNWAVLNSVLSTIEHSANKYSAKLYLVHYLAQPNLARNKYVLNVFCTKYVLSTYCVK